MPQRSALFQVEEDFVLILDADMVMRRPFIPEELGARKGQAVSAFYGYLKGVNNELALKHVPEIEPRNDTLAGPLGRRGDQARNLVHSLVALTCGHANPSGVTVTASPSKRVMLASTGPGRSTTHLLSSSMPLLDAIWSAVQEEAHAWFISVIGS
jgi:hypothetical protein